MQTLLDVINDNIKPSATKKTQKSEGSENEGLFSALLNSVNNENADETNIINAVLNFKQNFESKNELSSNLANLTKISEPKNLFEASNFLQILSLLEVLNGGKINKFPILNSKMTEFFAVEKNILEIKGAKNINELIKISQKFDLGLEKINITKDLTNKFEKEFVNLAKKDFFKLDNSLKFDEITKSQINKMSKSETKKEDTNLPKLLANLENKIEQKLPKLDTIDQKSIDQKNKTLDLNQENTTNDKKQKIDMQNIKIPSEEIKKQDIKLNQTEYKISNEAPSKQEIKSDLLDKNTSEQKILQPKQAETDASLQNKNLTSETKFDKVAKSDETTNKMSQKMPENIQKSEIYQDKNIERKSQDNFQIKQNILKDDMLKAALNPSMHSSEEQSKKDDNTQNQNKNNNNDEQLNLIVKDIVKNAQNQMKNIDTKKTFESFATNLKEQVENYKPPIMRVNLVLNPERLGEIEITIINRGNNLHINFNSTPQTMNLFLQNQAEFKASLVNMGFSELQMNFSDQNQTKDQSQNSKKFRFLKEDDDLNDKEMEQNLLEVIVPRYI